MEIQLKSKSFERKFRFPTWEIPLVTDDQPFNREEMILKYTPLIKYIAQRLAMRLPPHIAAEDLIGAGVIGLMDALDKFDPSKKVKFKTYAEIRIKGAMLDELRSLDWVSRSVRQKSAQLEKTLHLMEKKKGRAVEDEEVAQEMGLSLDDYYSMLNDVRGVMLLDMERLRKKSPDLPEDELFEIPMEGEENQLHYFFNQMELRDVLAWAIKELTPNEKTVISLYYFEQLTLKEIGEVLGYTESRICQIHTKAILKLRSKLKNLKKDTNPKVFVPHI